MYCNGADTRELNQSTKPRPHTNARTHTNSQSHVCETSSHALPFTTHTHTHVPMRSGASRSRTCTGGRGCVPGPGLPRVPQSRQCRVPARGLALQSVTRETCVCGCAKNRRVWLLRSGTHTHTHTHKHTSKHLPTRSCARRWRGPTPLTCALPRQAIL